jgi:hypothetical protein
MIKKHEYINCPYRNLYQYRQKSFEKEFRANLAKLDE